ncbi:tyrosine-type recombinase/integrase [Metaclostridioides mangenotii]|uniref:tyrosine-type recombinase/integrase n=1 Tax=Metaclostridioides mangenotii TaxID=1540 RepID=UPI0028F06C21|nr:tyrosine-type recombinase/integrase [Clostridioides mangenotii]
MQGGIRKRGKKWYYYFDLGIVDGKRKKVERVGGTTKKEAEKALRDAINEYESRGKYIEESEMSYSDFLDLWYENYVLVNCKTNTKTSYLGIIDKHLKPAIGRYKLKNIAPSLIQSFINSLYKSGYSKNYLSSIAMITRASLEYAVYPLELIKENPYKYIKLPKYENEKKEIKIITKEQFDKLIDRFPPGTLYYIPLQIGYYTGMRGGEVTALTWDDINLKEKTIEVNKTLIINGEYKYEIGTPKTKTSYRTITIGDTLVNILKKHKKYQMEMKLKYGEHYRDKEFIIPNMVCTNENGTYTKLRSFDYLTRATKKDLGFDFTFHMLRHTHATMLIQNGANPKEVQTRLGHANISVTLDTYAHSTEDSSRKVADIFENI